MSNFVKTILLMAFLIVAGCSSDVSLDYITKLTKQCTKNGGIKRAYTYNMAAAVIFECNDGAEFSIRQIDSLPK